jgi:hypothetical protein
MTHRQLNKFTMMMALKTYLEDQGTIVASIPGMAMVVAELKSLISAIERESLQQLEIRTGVGDEKRQMKAGLVASCADVARKLAACAVTNNDQVLLANCLTSDYKLSKMRDEQLVPVSRNMLEMGVQQLSSAAAFGLDQAGLDQLEAAITAFARVMPQPRIATLQKKVATENLVELFVRADGLLAKSDLLVAVVKLRHSNFYLGYKLVRSLVDRAGRGWQLKVTITEAESSAGIAGATCKILPETGTNTSPLLTRKSAARGSFGVKSLPAGSYRITVSKAGYLTKSHVFSITRNELERVPVALEKA